MEIRKRQRREGGFTLIELITVIIILGILAAVVTPQYFDMVTEAQNAALDGALGEATGRLNLEYANHIIDNGAEPANLAALTGLAGNVDLGDFTATYADNGDGTLTITASDADGNTQTKTVDWPGGN